MSIHSGPPVPERRDTGDPGPGWNTMWYCQTCTTWTDKPSNHPDHFLLEPHKQKPDTPTTDWGKIMDNNGLSRDAHYNDLEDDVAAKRRRLHQAEYELFAQISIRKALNNGLHNGSEYWTAIAHENYLIVRCLELQRITNEAQERLSQYDTDHLPNWDITPTDIPTVEELPA